MLKSFECVWLHEHFGLYQEWISIKKPRSSISRTFRYFNQKQNFGKFLRNFHFQICSFLDSVSFGVGFDCCWWWAGKFTNFIFAKLGFSLYSISHKFSFFFKFSFCQFLCWLWFFFSEDLYFKRYQSFSYLGFSRLGFLPLLMKEALDEEQRRWLNFRWRGMKRIWRR